MEGILRYLAETGRKRSSASRGVEQTSVPSKAAQGSPRQVRERLLEALLSDPLILDDASATAGVEAVLGGRIRTADVELLARFVASERPEAHTFEVLSPAVFGPTLAIGESPFGRLERVAQACPGLVCEATLDATAGLGTRPVTEAVLREVAVELGRAGAGLIRIRDSANRTERLQVALSAATRTDALIEAVAVLPGDIPTGRIESTVDLLRQLSGSGAAVLGIEDPRGALRPLSAYALVRTLRRELPALPVCLRIIDSVGSAVATAVSAVEAGAGAVTVVQPPLARPHAPPSAAALIYALGATERAPVLGDRGLAELTAGWKAALTLLSDWRSPAPEHDLQPGELPTLESIPPRAGVDFDVLVRRHTAELPAHEASREALLEAHDPSAYAERKKRLDRYGPLSQLPTVLYLNGLRPGEDAMVMLPNGGGQRHVLLRAFDGSLATFAVDGRELKVAVPATSE